MLVVFLSFVTGEQRVVKVFGLALASAVFLDAFVVRSLLLPSLLQLLGPRTWWLPAILERHLPHVAIDAPTGTSTRLRGSREHALEDATG
jgi:RND superfamily putative drug exporter